MTRARTLGLLPDNQEVIMPGTAPRTGQRLVADTYVTGPVHLVWSDASGSMPPATATGQVLVSGPGPTFIWGPEYLDEGVY